MTLTQATHYSLAGPSFYAGLLNNEPFLRSIGFTKAEVLAMNNGVSVSSGINKDAISGWMFHDMVIHYAGHIFKEVQEKFANGDINTQVTLDSVEYLLEILNNALPGDTDPEKKKLTDDLTKVKKKLDQVMADTII